MAEDIESTFDQIESSRSKSEALTALQRVAELFLAQKDFHRLFETRKFQSRIRAGVPPFYVERPTGLTQAQSDLIENELLDACREVGTLLAKEGHLGQAWPYLQPLDDSRLVEQLIEAIPTTELNIAELIDIGLYQRAHPEYGYGLILKHLGTCQAISAFDSIALYLPILQRRNLAGRLLEHVEREVLTNIVASLERNGEIVSFQAIDTRRRLSFLMDHYPNQVAQSSPHLDATHLVAAMRIARIVDKPDLLRTAIDLARYGIQLPTILQYASDAPFEQTYPDHLFYFNGLVGNDPDKAVEHFTDKFQASIGLSNEQVSLETLVALLRRIGRIEMALELAIQFGGSEFGAGGISPSLIELGLAARNSEKLSKQFRSQRYLLSFAALQLTRRQVDGS